MVTIKDIAKKLNLSYATVSLALNSSPLINKNTAHRVMETARKMEYQPNAMARGLVLKKSLIIGIIVPDVTNPFFAAVARGAEEAAFDRGYNLLICNTEWKTELESSHLRLIQEQKVDGLVVASINNKNKFLEKIIARNYPLVFISSSYPNADLNFVGVDSELGGYLAGRHLIELGHKKISFVGGKLNSESVTNRYRGFLKALEESNISYDESLTLLGDFTIESGYKNMIKLLDKFPEVTGAFAANDLIALGIMRACREKGLSIPADFSIVGYDDIFVAFLPGIELTTIFQEKRLMGKLAADLLLDLLIFNKPHKKEKKKILLSPKLIVRKSTGPNRLSS